MKYRKLKLKKEFRRYCLTILAICISFGGGWLFRGIYDKAFFEKNMKSTNIEDNTLSKNNIQNNSVAGIGPTTEKMEILAIGNSNLYSSFNPLQLWNETGITATALAAPNTNMRLSYYLLEKSLKIEKPKLIILEVNQFFEKKELNNKDRDEKISSEKVNKILVDNKKVKVKDTLLKTRGYYYSDKVVKYRNGFRYMNKNVKSERVNKHVNSYLESFINLAREKDCKILFVSFPSATSWNYKRHSIVNNYAIKYEIPYIDFNANQYDTQFNWQTDTRDAGNHLNHSGATKMTHFLATYLQKNYIFNDFRNNQLYKHWNEEYRDFMDYISNITI